MSCGRWLASHVFVIASLPCTMMYSVLAELLSASTSVSRNDLSQLPAAVAPVCESYSVCYRPLSHLLLHCSNWKMADDDTKDAKNKIELDPPQPKTLPLAVSFDPTIKPVQPPADPPAATDLDTVVCVVASRGVTENRV